MLDRQVGDSEEHSDSNRIYTVPSCLSFVVIQAYNYC